MMQVQDPVKHYARDAEEFDYFAPQSGALLDSTRRIQQAVERAAELPTGGRVLDLGSGSGWLARRLHGTGATCISVDLGLRNLQLLHRNGLGLQVVADAARLPFREGSFARVVASEILEHVNDPGRVVGEAARVLDADGLLVASTPYREILRTYLCIHCNKPTPANAHIHSFDEDRLRTHATGAGFRTASCSLVLNTAFLRLRFSHATRLLPFTVWRALDRIFTIIFRRAEIVILRAWK